MLHVTSVNGILLISAKREKEQDLSHNKNVLSRIRLPSKIPCHMYHLWLESFLYLLRGKHVIVHMVLWQTNYMIPHHAIPLIPYTMYTWGSGLSVYCIWYILFAVTPWCAIYLLGRLCSSENFCCFIFCRQIIFFGELLLLYIL